MKKFKKHTPEEFEAMTDDAYENLSKELYDYAVSLGIDNISEDDGPDYLEELIDLRLKPISKMGFTVSYSSSLAKNLYEIKGELEKLRKELIQTLSNWADGEIAFKRSVKVEDVEGKTLKVVSIFGEYYAEEDETDILCLLKSAPEEYENDYGQLIIPLCDLPLVSLIKLSDAVLDGAKVYSREEFMEIVERKR